MIKKTLLAVLFCATCSMYSQETVPASKGEATGSGGSSSYTVGQVFYTNNSYEAQGVQQASTTTWSGSESNVWTLAGNWSYAIPDTNSEVVIPANLTNYPTATLAVAVKTVAMASGSTLIASDAFLGSVRYKRAIGSTNWHLISSPVIGQDIDAFATTQSLASGTENNRGLSDYNNSTPAWTYWQVGTSNSGNFTLGDARSIKLTQLEDITFTGTISTANIDIGITSNTNGFNLIGNPYPSYIAANSNANTSNNLLTVNSVENDFLTEATLWFWDQSNGGSYIAKNLASEAFFIAPGQGFFVSANGSNSFSFTEAMQSHQATDTFLKGTITRPEIKLTITNGTAIKYAEVYYIEGTTTGWDNGYDSTMSAIGNNTFALYTHLLSSSEGQDLAIQSLPNTNYEDMTIPVGVNAASKTAITISAAVANLPDGINVYLEDKENASYTLLDSSSSFKATLSTNLSGIGRFYLHTTSNVLNINAQVLAHLNVYTSSRDNLRIVGLEKGVAAKLCVYDLLGKQVVNASFEAKGVHNIALPSHLTSGVYIVQLATDTGILNKKISIQ